ncbi:hypothetical protein MA16_Dca021675 [Dendrobium catenatum]|uniref:Uncharacterized protein n=1 Tax=Dendrobium catenatum TaxID=906689 RepID=A0A2I0V777_9ASPA|nr:hypothetical protein MA16_Dca021675 [Dendrobium catenatum]
MGCPDATPEEPHRESKRQPRETGTGYHRELEQATIGNRNRQPRLLEQEAKGGRNQPREGELGGETDGPREGGKRGGGEPI